MLGRHLDALAAHGVQLVRIDIGWSASQPRRGVIDPGSWYNRRIAAALAAAGARGLKVLFVLHQSPAWSRTEGTGGTGGAGAAAVGDVRSFPRDPASIRPWTTWLARAFGDRVVGFEVWNEPNLADFTGIADRDHRPARYVALLKEASLGLRAGRPGVTVVFGGPSEMDVEFVRACYRLGAKPYFDVMAVHPYQSDVRVPPDVPDARVRGRMANFPRLAAVMSAYSDSDKPVWWTEFGYAVRPAAGDRDQEGPRAAAPGDELTRGDGPAVGTRQLLPTPADAAQRLTEAFELARTRYPQVRLAVVYTTYRPPQLAGSAGAGLNLLDARGHAGAQLDALTDEVRQHPRSRPLR
jgi:hypothetical protein